APLLDVCRKRDPLERDSHFLRRSFEKVAHQLELDGVDVHWRIVCESTPFAHTNSAVVRSTTGHISARAAPFNLPANRRMSYRCRPVTGWKWFWRMMQARTSPPCCRTSFATSPVLRSSTGSSF